MKLLNIKNTIDNYNSRKYTLFGTFLTWVMPGLSASYYPDGIRELYQLYTKWVNQRGWHHDALSCSLTAAEEEELFQWIATASLSQYTPEWEVLEQIVSFILPTRVAQSSHLYIAISDILRVFTRLNEHGLMTRKNGYAILRHLNHALGIHYAMGQYRLTTGRYLSQAGFALLIQSAELLLHPQWAATTNMGGSVQYLQRRGLLDETDDYRIDAILNMLLVLHVRHPEPDRLNQRAVGATMEEIIHVADEWYRNRRNHYLTVEGFSLLVVMISVLQVSGMQLEIDEFYRSLTGLVFQLEEARCLTSENMNQLVTSTQMVNGSLQLVPRWMMRVQEAMLNREGNVLQIDGLFDQLNLPRMEVRQLLSHAHLRSSVLGHFGTTNHTTNLRALMPADIENDLHAPSQRRPRFLSLTQ